MGKIPIQVEVEFLEAIAFMCKKADARLSEEQRNPNPQADKLIEACTQGKVGLVAQLLSRGAAPNVVRVDGTPAGSAILCPNPLAILDLLTKASADLNLQDQNGWFPMFIAAGNDRAAVIRHLVKLGARINEVSTSNGWTSLMNSASFGYVKSTVELLGLGADTNIRSVDGLTAMEIATANQRIQVSQIFKKYFELIKLKG